MYQTKNWKEFILKEDHELKSLCRMDVFRGSGRGGQKKNKTSNAIRLSLEHLSVTENASRSKTSNIDTALKKMRLAIALDCRNCLEQRNDFSSLPEKVRSYSINGLLRINPKNRDYPLFLGCFLDLFIHHLGDWKSMAQEYGVSISQLRKFAQKNSTLLEKLKEVQSRLAPADIIKSQNN
ncbi:MAG: hypothetical protein COB67_09025 [SAR324 cluster bacterium]|uniref:Prokaryotic-type class I peptide chain release factors domain-containing protein n=1 Tax=SAR324 cluster bacterium TaxID=2024889 RepID=A0A2A4T0V3_9DELT|nr:MAG: hypothetical protein COB67_09025 [SAR324 cluster bacterium]